LARKLTTAFRGYLKQSSNDANMYQTLATGLQQGENYGLLIKRVEFELDSPFVAAWANADVSIIASLRRGAPSGVFLGRSNPGNIVNWTFACTAQASSVNLLIPTTFTWDAPPNLVIADTEMSVQFDSTATGQPNRLDYVVYAERTVLTPGQVIQLRAW